MENKRSFGIFLTPNTKSDSKLITQEDVKNSTGNGVAKELICMIHGHKLREEIAE